MKIVLIGMPTSGKSTISEYARNQGYTIVDVDQLLVEHLGQPLQDYINDNGEERFLRIENDTMLEYCYPEHCVVATGGSAVYCEQAMQRFVRDGFTIVFLDVPREDLKQRLHDQRKIRGIVMQGTTTWDELYDHRYVGYMAYATLVVDCANKDPKDIFNEIFG